MVESSALTFKSVLLRVSIVAAAARFGFIWLVATDPNRMLPFVVGDATGDVALLDEMVMVELKGVDGPGCGLGNVPERIDFLN